MPPREYLQLGLLAVLAVLALSGILLFALRRRKSPEERERFRRVAVNDNGRLADGYIIEATPTAIFYSYMVRGVEYTASQDVSMLREAIPGAPERLIGPVFLKYLTTNPANSIVVCEYWSGLRPAPQPAADTSESEKGAS